MRRTTLLISAAAVLCAGLIAAALVIANPFGAGGRAVGPAALLIPASFTPAQQPVVARINEAPDYARFFARLGEAFPKDQTRLIEALAQAPGPAPSIDETLAGAVRNVAATRGILGARASERGLDRVFTLQGEVAAALAKADARLCVDFIYGGASEGYYSFAAANRRLIGDYALAGLEAIVDGQSAKIEREKPSEADFKALEIALVSAGLTKQEIAAFIDGAPPDPPLPDDQLCGAGLTYFKVLAGLPAPLRMRIYALMLELMSKG